MPGHELHKEAWEALRRRINVVYYIGQHRVDEIEAKIYDGNPPECGPTEIGIDIDGDGIVDKTVDLTDPDE